MSKLQKLVDDGELDMAVMTPKVDYKSNTGRHRHKLCNHCSECGEPLLASYCSEHHPSWLIYWYSRISWQLFKLRAKLMNWEEL